MIESIIDELYENFVGFGLNSHFPGPNTVGMWPEEVKRLMWCELEQPNLNTIIIGSHNSGAEVVSSICKKFKNDKSDIIGIDIKFGEFSDLNVNRVKNNTGIDIKRWEIDSGSFNEKYKNYTNNKIGLVLIDGYHSYYKTLDDFKQVEPYLVEESICLFHDCSDKYPKANSHIGFDFSKLNHTEEDFEIDICISQILNDYPNFNEIFIPIGNDCDRRKEAQRDRYIKKMTSPFNSLFGIVKVKD